MTCARDSPARRESTPPLGSACIPRPPTRRRRCDLPLPQPPSPPPFRSSLIHSPTPGFPPGPPPSRRGACRRASGDDNDRPARRCGSRDPLRLLDRRPHRVAPLGPRAVVIAHVLEAEQIGQREPGVRGALADPAVGNDVVSLL